MDDNLFLRPTSFPAPPPSWIRTDQKDKKENQQPRLYPPSHTAETSPASQSQPTPTLTPTLIFLFLRSFGSAHSTLRTSQPLPRLQPPQKWVQDYMFDEHLAYQG